jgi:hypothetical protein
MALLAGYPTMRVGWEDVVHDRAQTRREIAQYFGLV